METWTACEPKTIMNSKFNPRPGILPLILLLASCPVMVAQTATPQRLAHAFALEKEGRRAPAIAELRTLLDSGTLDAPGTAKAWNILGLAYQDEGDFPSSRHAYEMSLNIFKTLQENTRDYAMVLDDLGELLVASRQFEDADKITKKALALYLKLEDHGGIARASCNLAAIAFNQKHIAKGSKYLDRAVKEAALATGLDNDDRAAIASLQGWQAQLNADYPRSIKSYRQALDLWKLHGGEHPYVGWGYLLLGDAEAAAGEFTVSVDDMKQGIAILDRALGPQNPRYLMAELAYSQVLDAAGSHAEAAQIKASAEPLLQAIYRKQCAGCTVSVASWR